ncbi:MAG: hypothetical protein D6776_05730 [Planctomycetota bacterium]|nr:MAG: hypothetical protein D6776_05730 [Planctomycetota bacterium]
MFASSDLADRRGRELDTRSYLYEAALEYGGSGGLVHAAIGRVGLWDLPTVGSVDGGRLGLRLGPLEVGGFGGLDAALDGSDRGRTSWGGYLRFETPPGEVWSWDLSTAYERTSTDGGGKLDRELIAADTRLRWHPWLTAYGRVELDLYGNTQNLLGRSDIELTDVYGSLTLRPLDPWTIGLSFDRRLPFFGEQTLRELAPEARTALPDEVLSTARLDTRVDLPRAWWVGAAVDLRRGGENGDRNTWTLEGGCYAISDEPAIGFDLALEAWQGDLWRGEAGRFGLSYSPLAVLDLSLRYELTLDRFEPTGLDVTRHDVQADVFWRMGRRMSLNLTGGWETGDDVDRQYVSLDWVYRF